MIRSDNRSGRILIVDDDPHMRSALSLSLKKTGMEGDIFASAEDALKFLDELNGIVRAVRAGGGSGASTVTGGTGSPSGDNYFLILSDLSLPGMDGVAFLKEIKKRDAFKLIPFVIITAYGSVESAVSAMKSGAVDYLLKPFDISDFERIVKNAEKISAYINQSRRAAEEKSDFIYESAKMKEIDSYIKIIAPSDATVLITGESGTGKEVAAKRIHKLSKRKGKFIGVNCSAIVSTLLESELFGHEKGAFTGAVSLKKGRFEQADGGTILLDEIAEMAQNLQAKILRALQEKTIDRVGGDEPVAVNVRIIAATNKDIEKTAAEGSFREDLFYRLNVIRLHLPPLRERREDIIPLAEYFTALYAKKYFREIAGITVEAQDYLMSLKFPGNIRELENIIERAVILAQNDKYIGVRHFKSFGSSFYAAHAAKEDSEDVKGEDAKGDRINSVPFCTTNTEIRKNGNGNMEKDDADGDESLSVPITTLSIKEMEEKLIAAALKETNGNRTKAAEKLGITARTLRNKLKELGLKF